MEQELVSVIMSVYNEAMNWIEKSVQSIRQQTHQNLQIIIVLDKPDNQQARELLTQYQEHDSRIELLVNDKNIGLVASLNRALTAVKGNYVARMDADDISQPERIETELRLLKEKNADFVMTAVQLIDEQGNKQKTAASENLSSGSINHIMKYGNISTHPTWLLRTKIYQELNGYRNACYCEDLDFILRAIQEGYDCYKEKTPLLLYRVRENGISQSYGLEQREKASYLRKCYKRHIMIKDLDVEKMNQSFSGYSEKQLDKYRRADIAFQDFSRSFGEKRWLSCLKLTVAGFFTNRYFQKIFKEYFLCFICRKRKY